MHYELVPRKDTESFQLNTGHKSAKEKCLQQILVSFANFVLFHSLFLVFIFLCVIFREFSKVFQRVFVWFTPFSPLPFLIFYLQLWFFFSPPAYANYFELAKCFQT